MREVQELEIKVQIRTLDSKEEFLIKALIDSGCTHSTIDSSFVEQHGLTMVKLDNPRSVRNVDGIENITGKVTDILECIMEVTGQDHQEHINLAITKLGSHQLFLGYDWIKSHNPSINWQTGSIDFDRCPPKFNCKTNAHSMTPWARASANISAEIAAAKEMVKEKKTWKEIILQHYYQYKTVFTKDSFNTLPDKCTWDHAINLKDNVDPILDCKIYPLEPGEQDELNVFLEENLSSGRIRLSQSKIASPFFFIKKKDGRLRPVQDYRKLNEMMIKNCYPLPLTHELIDRVKGSKFFTKLDICCYEFSNF
jgi:Retroviral aspartyl protease